MRGGCAGKIARAEAKLVRCDADAPALAESVRSLEVERVPSLTESVSRLRGASAHKAECERQRVAMREEVAAGRPSAQLGALQAQVSAARAAIQADEVRTISP